MKFYSASLLFKGSHSVQATGAEKLWEESIVLIEAPDASSAKVKAEFIGRSRESQYQGEGVDIVSWKFETVERICELESNLKNGSELFSRHLRDSEVQSLLRKFE